MVYKCTATSARSVLCWGLPVWEEIYWYSMSSWISKLDLSCLSAQRALQKDAAHAKSWSPARQYAAPLLQPSVSSKSHCHPGLLSVGLFLLLMYWWLHSRREAKLHKTVLCWYIGQLVTISPQSKIIPGLRIVSGLFAQQLKLCLWLQVWFKSLLFIYSFLVLHPLAIPDRLINFFLCHL